MPTKNSHTLLATVAHPDDESFGLGGTLALYAKRGVNVHVIVATDGAAGTVEPKFLEDYDSIAELRTAELECAAEALGLTGLHTFCYRDSGMPDTSENEHPDALVNQPVDEVAERMVEVIRQVRPDVVITHDPIGGYKHPDHIAVHEATVRAFHAAADPDVYPDLSLPPHQPSRLYYHTIPKTWLKLMVWLSRIFFQDPRSFGRNNDIDLVALVEAGDFPVHARIDYRSVMAEREAASECHASQLAGGPPNRGPLSWLLRLFGGKENYMRAYPEPKKGLKENDLFEGL